MRTFFTFLSFFACLSAISCFPRVSFNNWILLSLWLVFLGLFLRWKIDQLARVWLSQYLSRTLLFSLFFSSPHESYTKITQNIERKLLPVTNISRVSYIKGKTTTRRRENKITFNTYYNGLNQSLKWNNNAIVDISLFFVSLSILYANMKMFFLSYIS